MKMRALILLTILAGSPGAFAQPAPLERADLLSRLAMGQSASYLAYLVESRGISFTPTADFLDHLKSVGGDGVLIERLASAYASPGTSIERPDRPFDRLAKCSELIHIGNIEQAENECRAAADENPESAWPIMLLLRVLSETGVSPEERQSLLRRALSRDVELISAYRLLAALDVSANERDEAIERVLQLEQLHPDESPGILEASTFDSGYPRPAQSAAVSLQIQNQTRARIQSSLKQYPGFAAVHLRAGFDYMLLGELENGQVEIQEALRLEPGNPELHIALAYFYQYQNQTEAELDEYRAAVRLAPYRETPNRYLADALVREKRWSEAIQTWKNFLTLRPSDLAASNCLVELFLSQKDRASAIAELRRSLKASSDSYSNDADFIDARLVDLDRLARLLAENGDNEAAAQQYAYLLRVKPDSSLLHNNLGNVFYAQGDFRQATGEYRVAVSLQGDASDPHYNLANCLLAQDNIDEAVAEYRRALELDSDGNRSRFMLGIALAQKDELNAAIEQFRQVLAEQPGDADALASLALAHYRNNDHASAIAELKLAVSINPDSSAVLHASAEINATGPRRNEQNATETVSHASASTASMPR